MKKCLVCGEEKEDFLFVSNKKCKSCKRIVDKKYEQDNFEKIKAKKQLRRIENPEKYKKKSEDYYKKNKEIVLLNTKIRREKNKNHLETGKKYYQKNKEKILERCKNYRDKKREELGLPKAKVFIKNRFYIIETGVFLGIGITHNKSRRMYEHKRELYLKNMSFKPLYFFDCENDKLIRKIETIIKNKFCNINLKICGFKTETCNIEFLNDILEIVVKELNNSNEHFKMTKL